MDNNSKKHPETKKAQANKKDSSPKTADSMSTGVMIASILASVSLLSMAGFVIYRKKEQYNL